jgi:hypothetical protein
MPLHSDKPSAPASAFVPPLDSPPAPADLPRVPALPPPRPSPLAPPLLLSPASPPGLRVVDTSLPEHPGRIAAHASALDTNAENNCLVRFFTILCPL